jgi:hypothetical protein
VPSSRAQVGKRKQEAPKEPERLKEPVWLFPFDGMEVGDSFFVPTLRPAHMNFVIDSRAKAAKIAVKIFATTKDGHLGVRVWRVR